MIIYYINNTPCTCQNMPVCILLPTAIVNVRKLTMYMILSLWSVYATIQIVSQDLNLYAVYYMLFTVASNTWWSQWFQCNFSVNFNIHLIKNCCVKQRNGRLCKVYITQHLDETGCLPVPANIKPTTRCIALMVEWSSYIRKYLNFCTSIAQFY